MRIRSASSRVTTGATADGGRHRALGHWGSALLIAAALGAPIPAHADPTPRLAFPVIPTVTDYTSSSVTLTWPTQTLDGGWSVTGYQPRYRLVGEAAWTDFGTPITQTTATITSLEPGSPYEFQVGVVNAAGTSWPHPGRVTGGGGHTCALQVDGTALCWGANGSGQVGNGSTDPVVTPAPVEDGMYAGALQGIISMAAGLSHTCAALVAGQVHCWGDNTYGELGDGTTSPHSRPRPVDGITTADSVAAGGYHSCAVLSSGSVKCWGFNYYGQLGDGTVTNRTMPVDTGLSNILSVAAAWDHTCALSAVGAIYCWGDDSSGQLGDGTLGDVNNRRTSPVHADLGGTTAIAVSVGPSYTCALLTSGAVKCWGDNYYGQLGDGTTDPRQTPTTVNLGSAAVAIAAGNWSNCALLASGNVKCWGDNSYGQLGDGTRVAQLTPQTVPSLSGVTALTAGDNHYCAVAAAGGLSCWGYNYYGQLGDGTLGWSTTPVATTLPASASATAVSARGSHACVLLSTKEVACWGYNGNGELGRTPSDVEPQAAVVSGLTDVASIAAGESDTCAVRSNGDVYCWGYNGNGQLGDGTKTDRSSPTKVTLEAPAAAVSAGSSQTCAILTNNHLWCWGSNFYGQLGNNTYVDSSTPVQVVGLGGNPTSVSAGSDYTCATLDTGQAKCWGSNGIGRLGDGTYDDHKVPTLVALSVGDVATTIAAGQYHTCATLASGGAKCWGSNWDGQLGDGTTTDSKTPVAVAFDPGDGASGLSLSPMTASCSRLSSGTVKCWGSNWTGQLGDGFTQNRSVPTATLLGEGATAISASMATYSGCAVLTGGSVKCWGDNANGQLGNGNAVYRTAPYVVSGVDLHLPVVTATPQVIKPGTPVPTASRTSLTSLSVTWPQPSTGGQAITNYQAQWSPEVTPRVWTAVPGANVDASARTASVTGLTSGLSYVVRVAASNGSYWSDWGESNAVLLADVPGAPAPVASLATLTSIAVSWVAPSAGGATIDDYQVQWAQDVASPIWADASSVNVASRTASVSGLTSGLTYKVRARAHNVAGWGSWGVSSGLLLANAPAAPAPTATKLSLASLGVSWSPPASNGSAVDSYRYQYSSDGGVTWLPLAPAELAETTTTLTELTSGFSYQVRVAARNASGWGLWGTSSAVLLANVPGGMAALTAKSKAKKKATFTWSAPLDDGGSAITYFLIVIKRTGQTITKQVTGTTYTATGLKRKKTYSVTISACNLAGCGTPASRTVRVK